MISINHYDFNKFSKKNCISVMKFTAKHIEKLLKNIFTFDEIHFHEGI